MTGKRRIIKRAKKVLVNERKKERKKEKESERRKELNKEKQVMKMVVRELKTRIIK